LISSNLSLLHVSLASRGPNLKSTPLLNIKQYNCNNTRHMTACIYVNRNLTKAEAEAACQFRQAAVHRNSMLQNLEVQTVSIEPSIRHADVTMSLLNIASNPYTVIPLPPISSLQTSTSSNISTPHPIHHRTQQSGRLS
jgi:hypothetical protein